MADHIDITVEVAADLSASQYEFVKVDGTDNRIILCTSQGESALGILQEPVDGSSTVASARVRIAGLSFLRYGVNVTRNDLIATESDGEGGPAAAADAVLGYALETGVAGDEKQVVVTMGNGTFS